MLTKDEIALYLDVAADELEENGWITGTTGSNDTCKCALGALAFAYYGNADDGYDVLGNDRWSVDSDHTIETRMEYQQLVDTVAAQVGPVMVGDNPDHLKFLEHRLGIGRGYYTVYDFNDLQTDETPVINTFRQLAAELTN